MQYLYYFTTQYFSMAALPLPLIHGGLLLLIALANFI